MDTQVKLEKPLLLFLLCTLLTACTPAETLVQTAIAQTQTAAPTHTATGLSQEALAQTAVDQTLTPAAAAVSTAAGYQIQTAVAQTLTAVVPTQTATPLISPTPLTPTPTITNTPMPWPTITNTVEAFVPSGAITLVSAEDGGDNKVYVSWLAEGSFVDGFIVVWSATNTEPAYPGDYWNRFPDGHTRSAVVDVLQTETYYFRVCEYDAGGDHCDNYSNTVHFTNK